MDLSDLSPTTVATATMAWYMVPVAVLIASLMGSVHCLGMCGGIVAAIQPGRSALLSYHLGRLMAYLALGAMAGTLGGQLLNHPYPWLSHIAAVFLAGTLIWMGTQIWQGEGLHLPLPAWIRLRFEKVIGYSLKTSRKHHLGSGLVGLSTALLPCGWLYTFVLGAVATRSWWMGGLFLTAFWLGTLPLLSAAPWVLNRWLGKRSAEGRQVGGTILIAAGLFTLLAKFDPTFQVLVHHLCQ